MSIKGVTNVIQYPVGAVAMLRVTVFIPFGCDAGIWILLLYRALFNRSGVPMGDGLAFFFAVIATLLVVFFALPALLLALKKGLLGLALGLAVIPVAVMTVTL